ncbi:DinB family protein [Deinococcus aquaedulcis]|uniref:DinB family protein n=1 Tax=Deinococcus aquaedulcis TaxID=2840455 RepID=UPI001C83C2A9|nr:DinB family protein [Deinococcus aquaedulcis]
MSRRASPYVPALVTVATVGVAAGAAYLARTRKKEVTGLVVSRVLERPAARSSYADLAQSLERSGTFLAGRSERAADTHANRELLGHIIGIERWGQSRMEAALRGQSPTEDTYHPHRPPQDASMPELRAQVSTTRAATVDLARRLQRAAPDDTLTAPHNQYGDLSLKAWLRYLSQHADFESRRLRGAPAQTPPQEQTGALPSPAAKL